MALSAASYGVKALPGPPPMPGVNVDDGGTRAEGALAAGVVEFEPPAMELPAKMHCPEPATKKNQKFRTN